MLTCLWVSEPLSQPEIDQVNLMLFLPESSEEIVWLHVSMYEVIVMQELNALYHLVCHHAHCLQRELPFAKREQVFKRRPKEVHYHTIIVSFYSEPMHRGYANCHRGHLHIAYLLRPRSCKA